MPGKTSRRNDPPLSAHRHGAQRGVLLAEALAALAVVGLAAGFAGALVVAALRAERMADHLGNARRAAVAALARAGAVSWARLPGVLGGDGDDRRLAVASLTEPDHELVAGLAGGLPAGGRVELLAEGLAPGGAAARFREAVAIRLRARVSWRGRGGMPRRVELVDVRY